MNTNRNKINFWKWSNGETYYKSPRKDLKEKTSE